MNLFRKFKTFSAFFERFQRLKIFALFRYSVIPAFRYCAFPLQDVSVLTV